MNLLPKSSGSRPRIACEIFPGGVVAGRSPEPGLPLSSIAKADLPPNAIVPGLKQGNIADRVAVIAAVRRCLERIGGRSNSRNADLTLIVPDAAVRVLLLDFDALPSKLSEALPIVRFRLKKLVPFDTDNAMVSFQIMSSSRAMIRVLAVTTPRDVLSEYESVAREAGFEPGAVLPSTLAALAALSEGEGASLVVNAHSSGVTTAIVRAGILLLHRSIELAEHAAPTPANLSPDLFHLETARSGALLPLVDADDTQAEWAAQEALPEYGRNPYADRLSTESPTQDQDAVTGSASARVVLSDRSGNGTDPAGKRAQGIDMYAEEAAPVSRSPYASPLLQEQLDAQFHNTPYVVPGETQSLSEREHDEDLSRLQEYAADPEPPVHALAVDAQFEEIARAVSVAMAFFEDNLAAVPEILLSAGPFGADALRQTLREQGTAQQDGVDVHELVDAASVAATATAQVPRSWLAGVTGALRS